MATKVKSIRHQISPELRYSIYALDNYECVYCGNNLCDVPARERTLDHVKPASKLQHPRHKREVNSISNLVTCCVPCNNGFGNSPVRPIMKYGRKQP